MNNLLVIITKKPPLFFILSIVYLAIVVFLKWGIQPTYGTLLFLIGGFIGIYALDVAEGFFGITPSPFKSIIFLAGLIITVLYIVTSSGSTLASGLALSIYATMLFGSIGQWQINNNLDSWYRMIAGKVNANVQLWILVASIAIFFIETGLFIR